jgi:hypothetical protein
MTKKKAQGGLWSSLGLAFGNYFRTLVSELKELWLHLKDPAQRKDGWKKVSGFILTFYRRFSSESILKESASLTYITILGFIPFLMFILIIAPELPFLNLKDKFYNLVMNNFIPSSAKAVNTVFEDLLDRPAGFNIFTFVTMVITSYSLFLLGAVCQDSDMYPRMQGLHPATKNFGKTGEVRNLAHFNPMLPQMACRAGGGEYLIAELCQFFGEVFASAFVTQ